MTTFAPPLPIGLRLTQFQARLWDLLRKLVDPARGLCHASRTLAARLGCSERYVQVGLKFFRRLGLLRLVRDYGLRTRRRYVWAGSPADAPLLDGPPATPTGPPPSPNFLGAPECAESAHSGAPTDVPPLDPPYRCLGTLEGDLGDGGPAPPPPGEVVPVREEPEAPRADPDPDPDPEPDPALVARAAKVHPAHPAPARWVASLLARWSRRVVEAALGRAEACRATLANPPGYVFRAAEGIEREFGAAGPAPPPTREELNARSRAEREARKVRARALREAYESRQGEACR